MEQAPRSILGQAFGKSKGLRDEEASSTSTFSTILKEWRGVINSINQRVDFSGDERGSLAEAVTDRGDSAKAIDAPNLKREQETDNIKVKRVKTGDSASNNVDLAGDISLDVDVNVTTSLHDDTESVQGTDLMRKSEGILIREPPSIPTPQKAFNERKQVIKNAENKMLLAYEFESRKQDPTETSRDFSVNLRQMAHEAIENGTNEQICKRVRLQFLEGLLEPIGHTVRCLLPETFDKALSLAVAAETEISRGRNLSTTTEDTTPCTSSSEEDKEDEEDEDDQEVSNSMDLISDEQVVYSLEGPQRLEDSRGDEVLNIRQAEQMPTYLTLSKQPVAPSI